MEEFPRLRKFFDWPAAVGFVFGCTFLAFVVFPPAQGWGAKLDWGDVATWLSAIGTIAAAGAAVYAAKVAIGIAERDRILREKKAAQEQSERVSSVADAIYADLRIVLLFISQQLRLARGEIVGSRSMATGRDWVDWCKDQIALPVVVLESFSQLLPTLGDLSAPLMSVYGDVVRLRALVDGFDRAPYSIKDYKSFVQSTANAQLPQMINNVKYAMDKLDCHIRFAYTDLPDGIYARPTRG